MVAIDRGQFLEGKEQFIAYFNRVLSMKALLVLMGIWIMLFILPNIIHEVFPFSVYSESQAQTIYFAEEGFEWYFRGIMQYHCCNPVTRVGLYSTGSIILALSLARYILEPIYPFRRIE